MVRSNSQNHPALENRSMINGIFSFIRWTNKTPLLAEDRRELQARPGQPRSVITSGRNGGWGPMWL